MRIKIIAAILTAFILGATTSVAVTAHADDTFPDPTPTVTDTYDPTPDEPTATPEPTDTPDPDPSDTPTDTPTIGAVPSGCPNYGQIGDGPTTLTVTK